MGIINHFLFGEILKEVKLSWLVHLQSNYRGILTRFAFNTLRVSNVLYASLLNVLYASLLTVLYEPLRFFNILYAKSVFTCH